jgi:hypothetical protein
MKSISDTPVTLGNAAKTSLELIVWCKVCQHQNSTDPADVADLYGTSTSLQAWRERLVCSQCGSRDVEMLLMGRRRARH